MKHIDGFWNASHQMLEMQPAFVFQKRSEFFESFNILQTEMIFLEPNRYQIYLIFHTSKELSRQKGQSIPFESF